MVTATFSLSARTWTTTFSTRQRTISLRSAIDVVAACHNPNYHIAIISIRGVTIIFCFHFLTI
jgi:hypothetical protein